eukprot:s202_g8.t1
MLKEGLTSLGGNLRWLSSERQFADGLTKEATRQLLADRLRHHKVKFTWDPTYQAAKKKEINDRHQSRDEFSKAQDESISNPDENQIEDDLTKRSPRSKYPNPPPGGGHGSDTL